MPKLFDADGVEVEGAKTAEEIAVDTKAAADAARVATETEYKSKIDVLNTDLDSQKKAVEDLKKTGGKTPEEIAEIQKQEKEIKDKEQVITDAKNAAKQVTFESYADAQVGKLASGDKKLEEAIKSHLKKFSGQETQAEINLALRQAYVLAADSVGVQPSQSVLTSSFGGGGAGGTERVGQEARSDISGELAEFGKRFGLEQKDWDAWGNVKHSTAD